MPKSANITLIILAALGLMSGCEALTAAGDSLGCSTAKCIREYPRPAFAENPGRYDTLLVLPPQYALVEKLPGGAEKNRRDTADSMPAHYLEQLRNPARSYRVSLSPLEVQEDAEKEAVLTLNQSLWAEPLNPRAVIRETPLFGSPGLEDPVHKERLALPSALTAAAEGHCCILVTRITGWTNSPQVRNAKITTAIMLSVLPGASGVPANIGDVITDAAVIRVQDGAVLWASQVLGAGIPREMRWAVQSYYSAVYNARQTR